MYCVSNQELGLTLWPVGVGAMYLSRTLDRITLSLLEGHPSFARIMLPAMHLLSRAPNRQAHGDLCLSCRERVRGIWIMVNEAAVCVFVCQARLPWRSDEPFFCPQTASHTAQYLAVRSMLSTMGEIWTRFLPRVVQSWSSSPEVLLVAGTRHVGFEKPIRPLLLIMRQCLMLGRAALLTSIALGQGLATHVQA